MSLTVATAGAITSTTVTLAWPAPGSPDFAGYGVADLEAEIIAVLKREGASNAPQLLRWAITAVHPTDTPNTNSLQCLVTYHLASLAHRSAT